MRGVVMVECPRQCGWVEPVGSLFALGPTLANVRADGPRRLYTVDATPLKEVDEWVELFRGFWDTKLDALATEVARGNRKRKR